MAIYRKYKNGIFGRKYKGYYIIRGARKGEFAIWNKDKTVFRENILDPEECEWIIDNETADQSTRIMIKLLCEKEVYELSELYLELRKKKEENGKLEPESQKLYEYAEKIWRRKSENREL